MGTSGRKGTLKECIKVGLVLPRSVRSEKLENPKLKWKG